VSGNGIDLAAIYQLLTEVARKVGDHDRRFDHIDNKFQEIDARLGEMSADIAGLREAMTNYHASVLGHGILIGELEERVRRIERHLKLDPAI
jgi:chromosome segregation ATPase